jgi:hypothetical protein
MGKRKTYVLADVCNAIALLRPGAQFRLDCNHITFFDDPRPIPTWDEVMEVMQKINDFEDTIPCIELEE